MSLDVIVNSLSSTLRSASNSQHVHKYILYACMEYYQEIPTHRDSFHYKHLLRTVHSGYIHMYGCIITRKQYSPFNICEHFTLWPTLRSLTEKDISACPRSIYRHCTSCLYFACSANYPLHLVSTQTRLSH